MTTEQRLYLDSTCAKALAAEAGRKYDELETRIERATTAARKACEARVAAAKAAEMLRSYIAEAHIASDVAEDGYTFATRADLPGASEEALESLEALTLDARSIATHLYELAECAEETAKLAEKAADCIMVPMTGWTPRSICDIEL